MYISGHLKSRILTIIMTKNDRSPKKSIKLFPNFICEKVSPLKNAWCQNYKGSKLRVLHKLLCFVKTEVVGTVNP